ncbi:Ca-activated chloride channel family protein [Lentzea albidocapillata subsp. violacea]|uniref:Ca-activated chloride channel family protein n=1 Tax=Lentzea albidocapillata subsp. violacea TaxID=128104 RepID=A0A1G8PLP2_9PSEU|nr:substrate-binding domain-containing protein [Lentzea albidocapillata]SDI93115.1 Ca-activated chloride channel family protein [Lentzea albidocapillata subsp. violacea]
MIRRLIPAVAVVALLAGCSDSTDPARPVGDAAPGTLRVLAGSELADLQPILDEAAKATGISVRFSFTGTIEGAEKVASGAAEQGFDAVWFSSNRYLELVPEAQKRLGTPAKVMSSPVVLGLPAAKVRELGWDTGRVGWAEIAEAAGARKFTYGMTDPSVSNSGFSALVGVAAALSGSGSALDAARIDAVAPQLKEFFSAQKLSAGSSGWLSEAYQRRAQDPGAEVDGLINYESVLLSMPQPLTLVYPSDGVVTADYPLTLLTSASSEARDAHQKLSDHLRSADVQRKIMETTHRRPAVPQVRLDGKFATKDLVELPFPGSQSAVDGLITTYFDRLRRPSRTLYVLDTSGSMQGDRIDGLRQALTGLTGADESLAGRFSRFHGREQVTLLPFSSSARPPLKYEVPQDDPRPVLDQIRATATSLDASGGTAIYSSLRGGYDVLRRQIDADPDRFTSIVLMTDGENTGSEGITDFQLFHQSLSPDLKGIPIFPVLFGESATTEMEQVAKMSGGKVFDARSRSLSAAFKEIRGYQ